MATEVDRRGFLRSSLIGSVGAGLGVFGLSFVSMLQPGASEGFGSKLEVPTDAEDLYDLIESTKAPFEFNVGRCYVVTWDPSVEGALDAYSYSAQLDDRRGLMAVAYKCVHLGCKVPWCQSSQWFECPCHGSKYNKWAEWTGGPAPRGLDRFSSEIVEGKLVIDTGNKITGPARTAAVLKQEPEGPNCISL